MNEKKIENKWTGSRWGKWDLHIHTPKTFMCDPEYSKVTIDEFVDKISESGLVAIGLTNYFKFHDSELKEIKQKLEEKDISVFPNIELRITNTNKDEWWH